MQKKWYNGKVHIDLSEGRFMVEDDIPIFIGTPLAGQSEVFIEEWMKARLDLFDAVTLTSMMPRLREGIYWMIFIGDEPAQIVLDWVEENLAGLSHIYVLRSKWTSQAMNEFVEKHITSEHFISCNIGDDDAWPLNHFETVVEQGRKFINDGRHHIGWTYRNGYEWVASDTVDLNFLNDFGFKVVIPELLMVFDYPWLAQGLFILQTRDRIFRSIGSSHRHMAEFLEKEGFETEVLDNSEIGWLYTRHQLADSGISRAYSKPLDFTLETLEEEFGLDAEKVRKWISGPYSSMYCEKNAHKKGIIEMYDIPHTDDYVIRPYNYLHMEDGVFRFNPKREFHVSGKCRLRVWDDELEEFRILMVFDADTQGDIVIDPTMLPLSKNCKFDIQVLKDNNLTRVMSYIGFMFD